MLKLIRKYLEKIVSDIDAGNSNLSDAEALKVLEALKSYSDREVRLSKYQACQYLNMSRASFDNYVRFGKIPKGIKEAGFKELFWTKKSLDEFIASKRG